MDAFIQACIHLDPIALVRAGGYLGIALIVFAESGILLGIFFPGDSLLFTAGLLSAGGFLSIVPLTLLVIISAILGDSVGYWFGKKVGNAIYTRPDSRFFKQTYVTRTQAFYAQYGGRAIVLARFVPIVRTIAPILAGVGTMKYPRFLSYNLVGGTLWGASMTLLGFSLGSLIPEAERYILPIALAIIVLSFLPIVFEYLRNKRAA